MLFELVRRVEPFLTGLAFESADLEMPSTVISKKRSFRKFLATLQALVRLCLVVARPGKIFAAFK